MISLPMGFLIEANNFFAISPLGVWPYEWFQNVTQCKCKNIFQYCKEFFPWWQKDQDASFWLNMALTLLWVDCPWHTPANRKESMTLQNIIACLENAYLLDPTLKYPWSEWLEILELLEAPDKVQTLKQRMPDKTTSTGIGFRKMNCSWNLTGQWHIWIPGYFYSDLEDNDSSVVLWYKGRTVRGSSISFEGTPRPSLDELMDDKSSFAEIIPLETQEEIDGYAGLKEIDEDGKKYWMLQGAAVSSKSMAYITICFDDINDKKWACDAWQSISLHQAQ